MSNTEKIQILSGDDKGKWVEVPIEGSLGLLALGYRGIQIWREAKSAADNSEKIPSPSQTKA